MNKFNTEDTFRGIIYNKKEYAKIDKNYFDSEPDESNHKKLGIKRSGCLQKIDEIGSKES